MLKGLPRGFTYDDFDELLMNTGMLQLATRRYIPRCVFNRRDDATSPLAIAFVHFANAEHADLAWNALWHQSVLDREEDCFRLVKTAHATPPNREIPTPEVPPEPSQETKPWKAGSGMKWTVKPTSQPSDDHAPQTPANTQLAITDGADSKKPTPKTFEKTNHASTSWDTQSWGQQQWDTDPYYDNSSNWWQAQGEVCQAQGNVQLYAIQDDPQNLAQPRFKCIKCYQPFMKWSQCSHHIRTTCLPRGIDPTIVDDDESIRMICERLCDPF